jgi:hypothetical protein
MPGRRRANRRDGKRHRKQTAGFISGKGERVGQEPTVPAGDGQRKASPIRSKIK